MKGRNLLIEIVIWNFTNELQLPAKKAREYFRRRNKVLVGS